MKWFPSVVVSLCLFGCGDDATDRYETRADAEADLIFGRGWLPWIIPDSSRNIVTSNDLDVNTSEGGFDFDLVELEHFTGKLNALNKKAVPENPEHIRYWEQGYNPYEYQYQNSKWTFYIHPKTGHCRYWLEPTKLSSGRYASPLLGTPPTPRENPALLDPCSSG